MPYGTIKVDTVTFTDAGVDKSVSISGLVQNPTFSGNITVTGTISGGVVRGGTISGATVTGTAGEFTTATITSGVFASGTAAAPSITFAGDLDTGLFTGAANTVGIAANGAAVLTVSGINVGIGVPNPSAPLNVRYDNTGLTTIALFENQRSVAGSPDAAQIVVGSRGYNHTIIRQNSDQGSNAIGNTLDTVIANTYGSPGAQLILATQSTARLIVGASGNVGIGSASDPGSIGSRLWIDSASDTYFTINTTGSTNLAAIHFRNSNGNGEARLINNTGGAFTFYRSPSSEAMRITSGGLVGIGTDTVGYKFEVKHSDEYTIRLGNSSETGHGSHDVKIVAGASYYQNPVIEGSSIKFNTYNGSALGERVRIDSIGRLLIGGPSSITNVYVGGNAYQAPLQIIGNAANYGNGLTQINYSAAGYASTITLGSSKNATIYVNGAVASGDDLGLINFVGNDGTNFRTGAYIIASAAGTVATGDVPTKLTFWTKQSGVAGPTEVMRISPTQRVGIGGSADPSFKLNIYCDQDDGMEIYETSSGNNRRLRITQNAGGVVYNATYSTGGNAHNFQIGNGTVALIDSNGRTLLGGLTNAQAGAGAGDYLQVQGAIQAVSSSNIYSRLVPSSTGLNIIANAYPANIGSTQNIKMSIGTAGGGGPSDFMLLRSTGRHMIGAAVTSTLGIDYPLEVISSSSAGVPAGLGSYYGLMSGSGYGVNHGSDNDNTVGISFELNTQNISGWRPASFFLQVARGKGDATLSSGAWYIYSFIMYAGSAGTFILQDSGGSTANFTISATSTTGSWDSGTKESVIVKISVNSGSFSDAYTTMVVNLNTYNQIVRSERTSS